MTVDNESLIRTHHRSLASYSVVVLEERSGNKIWVVAPGADARILDTHAAGREIHVFPTGITVHTTLSFSVFGRHQEDPIEAALNPRRLLRQGDLNKLREMAPTAVGARLLISGYIVILFRTSAELEKSWVKDGHISEFGGLRVIYDVMEDYPTKGEVPSGTPISSKPDNMGNTAALGLKLRFADGLEAITVPTHAFVKCKGTHRPALLRVFDWYARVKSALEKFLSPARDPYEQAVGQMRESSTNSPLGKTVWLAGDSRRVSSIPPLIPDVIY